MTFPVPSVAGVFLSLSNRLKTAITDGSAAHYLLGRTPTRLRNHLGFHAALAEMADALLERAVLPYQITSSLSSLTVLPTAQLSGTDVLPVQIEAKTSLPALLATVAKRAKLGTEKRYAPLEFWRAILDGINSLSSSQGTFLWPRNAASEDYADVVIYPSICRTIGDYEMYGYTDTYVDLYDSGWAGDYLEMWDVLVKVTHSLVEWQGTRGDENGPYMLSKLVFDFEYESETWYRLFGYLQQTLIGASSAVVEREQIPSLPSEKLDAIANWSPMEPERYYDVGRKPTARPNLDLLRVYQILLGCFWANWAKMKVQIKVPHLVTTRTAVYTVYWEGRLSQDSDSTSTEVVEKTNTLEWSHDISDSTYGEWSNAGGVYGGTAHIGFYLSEMLYDSDVVDAAVADAQQRIDSAWAAYEQAEAAWRARYNELVDAVNNAFSNIPASAREQFAEDLMDNVNDVQGLTYINTINVYANGQFVDMWVFNPVVYLPISSDQARGAFDRFSGMIRNDSKIEDAGGNLTFTVQGGYSFGISVPEVAAASRAISNARQAEQSAFDAMNSAYNDYEQAVGSYGPTAQDGVSVDVTDDFRHFAGLWARIEWDGEEPKHPPSQPPVKLTVVSTETHPITGSGAQSLRALLMTGGHGTRTSPWPAGSLINGSYVKSEKVAFGARMKDDYFDTSDTQNNGYYNYRETSGEPQEGESRYRATRNVNSSGEKAPTGKTFRRLLVGEESPASTAPSDSAEYAVGRLVDDATGNVSARTVGGALPLMLYGIHPHGTGGTESSDDWISGIGPFYAWYHPDKSAKVYENSEGSYHYQRPNDPNPVPAGYSFANKYCPWQITGPGGQPVYWNWDDDGYPAELTCTFSYTDDARSQSASAENPPHRDRLLVDLSRHLAVRAEWNWKSMPVTHN